MAAETGNSIIDTGELIARLVAAWGSWGPTMTPDADRVAFISDRSGLPQLWVQAVVTSGELPEPSLIRFCDDPVTAVTWSADSAWLACAVATDGGVRSQVWVVRPDGTDARRIAGDSEHHAELGPWTRSGHRVVVTVPSAEVGEPTRTFLVEPVTGHFEPLAVGELIHVLDLSVGEALVVIRDGRRGHEFCVVVDRLSDEDHPLMPPGEHGHAVTGATTAALIRPAPAGAEPGSPVVAYLATEVGAPRQRLVALPLAPDGWRGVPRVLAERADAELEALDADDAGRLLLLVWNCAGRSVIELYDTTTDECIPVAGLPGLVATSPVLSRDGSTVILSVEGPLRPRELWRLDTAAHSWTRVTQVPALAGMALAEPTLEHFTGEDGLRLSGWLYRAPGGARPRGAHAKPIDDAGEAESARSAGPAMLSLHGGPEAQERPTFNPQHQAMVAAGITVFAPNVRGSSGFGREFSHLDDVHRRQGAFDDVLAAARFLVDAGLADAGRIAVTGRSYGGYLTLAALAFSPGVFAAAIDICGMSHMMTFYRDTEPWIAAAAVTKYGHPEHDQKLLRRISPLVKVSNIDVPLLVAHGELDTNVPVNEARQVVAALRELGRPVEYLELAGEGHEYRRAESKLLLAETMVRFLLENLSRIEG
ncbi:S9 family peptidase [Subtercola frigoramans]|uniref:Acyl-peptide hydrolase n=1 Tax=Subtercola frigoramans TaxID=120298 RepID=A0ABS2L6G5_9MICO|nr:S9 family peptidase [Subtercola frigoramans]MBM7472691.1 dipeptidyl aminopeptidase/acylaminoacyl peptidase [Subtercola frigoramans]